MIRERILRTLLSKKGIISIFVLLSLTTVITLIVAYTIDNEKNNYFEEELEEIPTNFDIKSVDFLKEYLEDDELEDLYVYIENLYLENSDKYNSFSYIENSFAIKSEIPFRATIKLKSDTGDVFTLNLAKLTIGLEVTHG